MRAHFVIIDADSNLWNNNSLCICSSFWWESNSRVHKRSNTDFQSVAKVLGYKGTFSLADSVYIWFDTPNLELRGIKEYIIQKQVTSSKLFLWCWFLVPIATTLPEKEAQMDDSTDKMSTILNWNSLKIDSLLISTLNWVSYDVKVVL